MGKLTKAHIKALARIIEKIKQLQEQIKAVPNFEETPTFHRIIATLENLTNNFNSLRTITEKDRNELKAQVFNVQRSLTELENKIKENINIVVDSLKQEIGEAKLAWVKEKGFEKRIQKSLSEIVKDIKDEIEEIRKELEKYEKELRFTKQGLLRSSGIIGPSASGVEVQLEGVKQGVFSKLNFVQGNNISITQSQVSPEGKINLTLDTNNSSLTNTFVPYTGATQDLNLGSRKLIVDTNTLYVDSVNHRVGIGRAPSYKFHLYDSGNAAGGAYLRYDGTNIGYDGLYQVAYRSITTTGTYYTKGLCFADYKAVASGVTDNGYIVGFWGESFAGGGAGTHAGTLNYVYGGNVYAGIYGTTHTGTVNNVFVLSLGGYAQSGTITNLYTLYLRPLAAGGTVTNYWGIYQADTAATNYFAGKMGIRTTTPNSTLHINGSIATALVNKTAAYTLTAFDSIVTCDASAGAFTISLPTASGIAGRQYTIKKIDSSANAITIQPYGTETIDGAATYTLSAQWKYVTIVSNGTNWLIVSAN